MLTPPKWGLQATVWQAYPGLDPLGLQTQREPGLHPGNPPTLLQSWRPAKRTDWPHPFRGFHGIRETVYHSLGPQLWQSGHRSFNKPQRKTDSGKGHSTTIPTKARPLHLPSCLPRAQGPPFPCYHRHQNILCVDCQAAASERSLLEASKDWKQEAWSWTLAVVSLSLTIGGKKNPTYNSFLTNYSFNEGDQVNRRAWPPPHQLMKGSKSPSTHTWNVSEVVWSKVGFWEAAWRVRAYLELNSNSASY